MGRWGKLLDKIKMFRNKRFNDMMEWWTWDRYKRIKKDMEWWTWERYQRTEEKMKCLKKQLEDINEDILNLIMDKNLIRYNKGEKIRIVILFQIPSCWASLESVWRELEKDERFEAKMLLYDREQKEPIQMAGARELLEKLNITYIEAEYYDFTKYKPHIILYQTPWDERHRPSFLWADQMKKAGIRVAYLPYGIEYSASVDLNYIFSNNQFKTCPWRSYVLSENMKIEHRMKSPYGASYLVATGLPKFDSLYYKSNFLLEDYIQKEVKNRKIILWQMHFPAFDGNKDFPEPNILVYLEFANKMKEYKELFFLVRPHPKFFEMYKTKGYKEEVKELKEIIENTENAYCYLEPDYRNALMNADYMIGDRSALMIEAIVLNIPVLYMTNFYYKEKILSAVEPIFESYYQGSVCYDIELFIDMVIKKGIDYKKQDRERAKDLCIPFFDGKCGLRIVNDLAYSIYAELEEK